MCFKELNDKIMNEKKLKSKGIMKQTQTDLKKDQMTILEMNYFIVIKILID